jgi:hypothetical protein
VGARLSDRRARTLASRRILLSRGRRRRLVLHPSRRAHWLMRSSRNGEERCRDGRAVALISVGGSSR